MPEVPHTIQRHVFDISYPVREKAYDLQSRFSRLFDRQAMPVMTGVFDRLVADSLILRLDTLALDLGSIHHDRLEKDFPDRLRDALERELQRILQSQSPGEWQDRAKTLTDLLEYFLLTGSLPWWAAGALLKDPAAVADQLIRDDPQGLRRLLLSTGQHEDVRQRLIHQYPETTNRRMVQALEPDEAAFIFVYHADIIHVRSAQPFFRQDIGEFRRNLWLFIFTYLLVDRGSNFNRKIFVKSTLTQMARQYNMEYASLLTLLFRALEATSPALVMRSALPGIIHTLFEEEERGVAPEPPPGPADLTEERIGMIRSWLLHGRLPGRQAAYDAPSLSAIFTQLITEAPHAVHELMRSLTEQEGIWARIVDSFDEEAMKSLVRLREPEEAGFIFHYAGRLAQLQRQQFFVRTDSSSFYRSVWELILAFLWTDRGSLFNTRRFLEYHIRRISKRHHLAYRQLLAFLVQGIGGEIRSDRDSSLFHSLTILLEESEEPANADSHPPINDAPDKPPVSPAPLPDPPRPASEPSRRPASEPSRPPASEPSRPPAAPTPDTLYVHNAGLVLLHPLLPHFLQRLGLTTPLHQFVDAAARHRSAHLLQYLVTGRPDHPEHRLIHPEHQLVLNKLLCEIPIREPIPPEIVITEEEVAVAAELFAVLRQRWPKILNTSDEGLRQSFLQRDGSLTETQDGWRLRVQQKGIDVLLQFLPWSVALVRLPWMNTTIYTEWI